MGLPAPSRLCAARPPLAHDGPSVGFPPGLAGCSPCRPGVLYTNHSFRSNGFRPDLSILVKKDQESTIQRIAVDNTCDQYALEADTVAAYIDERQAPAMTWNDTLENMRALDRWRAALGVVYETEKRNNWKS